MNQQERSGKLERAKEADRVTFNREINELALFAGAGGGILGSELLGFRTVCAVEIDDYARSVLLARQNDGSFRPFPVWDDVRTFDGKPWCGIVDLVSGGFPCQDISVASAPNGKELRRGLRGRRSGLWSENMRIIREVQPAYVFGENSPELRRNGLGDILRQLAASGIFVDGSCWVAELLDCLASVDGSGSSLPTPTTRDWKDTFGMEVQRQDGKLRTDRLPMLLFYLAKDAGIVSKKDLGGTAARVVRVRGWAEILITGLDYHPEFPEWVMGWPIGWTELEPLGTGKYQQWRRLHGGY